MAQPIKVKGLIIRQVNYGDYDKMLTVLTDEMGKISVSAKGVRSMKNKNRAACQLLCFNEFVLKEGKNEVYGLQSSELIESFYPLREDCLSLALGIYMADLAGKISQGGTEGSLKLLLNSLFMLTEGEKDIRIIKLVFELKLLSLSGFTPDTEGCVNCGETVSPFAFSAVSGGVLCKKCADLLGLSYMNEGTRRLLSYILESKLSKGLYLIRADESKIAEGERYVKDFIRSHIAEEIKTLTYFEKLVKMP